MKKIFLALFVFSLLFTTTTTKVLAAAENAGAAPLLNWGSTKLQPFGDIVNQDANKTYSIEKWLHGAQNSKGEIVQRGVSLIIIDSLICYAIGCPPSNRTTSSQAPGGALGALTGLIGAMYASPPANTQTYIAYMSQNFLPQPAYAQNLARGSDGMVGIVGLWGVFRTLTYVFFIVILVVIGFMIMFRQKIDPQTVVSIQNSLPQIAITLLLVTLSYAIAGLTIDISNVMVLLMAYALEPFHDPTSLLGFRSFLASIMGSLASQNIFSLMSNIGTNASTALGTSIQKIIGTIAGGLGGGAGAIVTGLIGDLAALVLAFAVIGAMFKTFFALLSSYVQIIFLTVFSPLILLGSAMPGKGKVAKGWFVNLLSNTLVFAVLFVFLDVGAIISGGPTVVAIAPPGPPTPTGPWYIRNSLNFSGSWVPFGLSGFSNPLAAGFSIGDFMRSLIGLGVVMTAPSIPQVVKEFFETKESALGAGTAQALHGTLSKIPLVGSLIG